MTKKSPAQVLKDIKFLESRGISTPLPALAMLQQEDLKQRGIRQLYRCQYCKPSYSYESPVDITSISCPAGHGMKMIWQL